eukprot:scaffold22890_cov75-Phaeocystis_antarctica.AAC.4
MKSSDRLLRTAWKRLPRWTRATPDAHANASRELIPLGVLHCGEPHAARRCVQQQLLAGAQAKSLEGHVHGAPGRNQRGGGLERQCRGLLHKQPCIGPYKAREAAVGRPKGCGVHWQLWDVRYMRRDGASDVSASGCPIIVAWALPQHNEHIAEVEADCTDPHLHLAVSESSVRLRLRGDLQVGNRTHHL